MSASAASVSVQTFKFHEAVCNSTGTANNLDVFPNGAVGLSTEVVTQWFLVYIPERGSYRIWQHTTTNVLDATRATGGNTSVWPDHGADWQHDSRLGSNRVTGYTLTPLSQPQHVLTMASPFGDSRGNPATPAQLREAPRARTRAWVLSSEDPTEEGQPWQFGEEFDFESSYCEEVQAQIAQAEEQIAGGE
ncbi:uncharacterized protein F5147DRAFT_761978 [Suillus discolor]|uniref:Uncharacterized protein n=1 Tax=Suillus discolor TaxID=1912936 RepID=A0A9P7F445_9AGAM|nr:uncharacterized protein F5147DRAFT_761978 [Suillus discolor]KAG2105043.1 hypothetical protein F5147DRAFT_761978 [Suillus discolor]